MTSPLGSPWARISIVSALLQSGGAQAVDDSFGPLAEVVVTAEKHAEALQQVPLSIQVVSEAELRDREIRSLDDTIKLLTSVSTASLGPGQSQLYFRGITSAGGVLHAGALPASSVYLDEIPVTTIGNTLDDHLYDIARIEALAGPQGTLYGASSLSGTLRIITNKPDASHFGGGYDLHFHEYWRGDPGVGFEGFVNIPLVPNAALRLVGYYDHEGGYINNVYRSDTLGFGVPAIGIPDSPMTYNNAAAVRRHANPVDTYGGRGALKIDLNERWTITPQLLAQSQRARGDFTVDPQRGDLKVADYLNGDNYDRWYQAALTVTGKLSNFDVLYAGGWFERQVDNTVDYSAYTIAYDQAAHLPDANVNYVRFYTPDGSLIGNPLQYNVNHDKYTKMTHELRVSTPLDRPLRGLVGLFYQRQTDDIRAEFRIDDLPDFYAVDGSPKIVYLTQQTRVDRDYAVFTELNLDVTTHLRLNAGIRRFWAQNSLYGFFGFSLARPNFSGEIDCNPPVSAQTIVPNYRPCINTNSETIEDGETHKINLSYRFDADRMLYAQYATGFRPGGNNRRVGIAPYAPDTITELETGWKTTWFAQHLRVNGALFFERWRGIQTGAVGAFGIGSIDNVGDAAVKGVELQVDGSALQHLFVEANATWLTARTLQNLCQLDPTTELVTHDCAQPVAIAGSRLAISPTLKTNFTTSYRFRVGGFENFLQGTVFYQGATLAYIAGTGPQLSQSLGALHTIDFDAGSAHGQWRLSAYLHNALDRRGGLGSDVQCAAEYCFDNYRILPVPPRQIGIHFSQTFK